MEIRMSRLEKSINEMKALVVTPPVTVKAVEEICVTCGANHNFNNCPLTRGGFESLVFHDNLYQFQQTVAVGNFVQANSGYRPPSVANQIRPPGFTQPNTQNNNRNNQGYNQNQGYNRNQGNQVHQGANNNSGLNHQALAYQAPVQQAPVTNSKFEAYTKANDANMNNLQMKLDNFQRNQNDFQRSFSDSQKKQEDFQNMMLSFMQNSHNSNTASTSRSGTLPSQTVTNPREHVNAITTRSGKTCEGPSTPLVSTPDIPTPQKEPEQNPKTSMDKVQKPSSESSAQVPPPEDHDSIFIELPKPKAKKTVPEPSSPEPNSYQPKLPYPERMKVREKDKPSAQQSRFMKLFKQLRLEIGLKDALIEMPKFNKWLSALLRNKEKLEEIAITTVNAECSAIILNKVPEKLEDPGKFLIPCALQELDRTNALADSGASINLLPHSIYKQLGLGALKPTRMTLELANRSVTHPMGIAEDVVVRVDGFTFLADFVVVNFEPDPRVPIILGRPFLRTAKALIDLYEEKLTLRVGNDELVFYADKSEKNKNKKFAHAISIIDFSKDEQFSGSTTIHSDALLPSSSPVKTSDNLLEEFADEFTLPNPFPPGNDDSILKKDVHEENFQIYSNSLFEFEDNFNSINENPLFNEMEEDIENENSKVFDEPVLPHTPFPDKVECFNPGGDNDEIDAFLAIEVPTYIEGYYDSEGDVLYLESLLSEDTTHNLSPKVFRNEPENEPLVTFSPKSDPLHHEFTGEIITIPPGIVREHEDYINRMSLLCSNSSSQSPENSHTIIESPPTSTTLVEDSDPNREEIDIFSG
ncbi:reverse transcriptase domain-containing protein [Tanacetum coccineum]|uniref:Reverse transcriptase domain-containing protein n=1 Tax=Tanacetum coccineum TaxID=301880 RepID=A0ABQ5H2E9_9ASTR